MYITGIKTHPAKGLPKNLFSQFFHTNTYAAAASFFFSLFISGAGLFLASFFIPSTKPIDVELFSRANGGDKFLVMGFEPEPKVGEIVAFSRYSGV